MLRPCHLAACPDCPAPGDLDPGPGRQRLAGAGTFARYRRPRFGDTLPDALDDHSGAVIYRRSDECERPGRHIAQRSTGSAFPLREQRRFSASASARRCLTISWARVARIRKAARDRLLPDPPTAAGLALYTVARPYHCGIGGIRLPAGAIAGRGGVFRSRAFQHVRLWLSFIPT
jgi:GMP synthase (glutamine-hydrolysing)